jgi:hypothetical protein
MVISLAPLPPYPRTDALLIAGGELWLARARAFAMHALADVRQRRETRGRGGYSLFTGDIRVALLVASCLRGDARFPFLADQEKVSYELPSG